MHIRHYLATLEFVNRERVTKGLDPIDRLPEGRPGLATDCVIARAVPGAAVGSHEIRAIGSDRAKKLPLAVSSFVHAFDTEPILSGRTCDPANLVEGGIDDEKGCLVTT